jgi:hypothetical protein
MSAEATSLKIWPLPAAIVGGLAVFAGTFFAYAERHRLNREGSYLPAIIGIGAFSAVMLVLTAAMLPKGRRTVGVVLGIVAGETIAFIFALMFLLLNIYGS